MNDPIADGLLFVWGGDVLICLDSDMLSVRSQNALAKHGITRRSQLTEENILRLNAGITATNEILDWVRAGCPEHAPRKAKK